MGGNGKWRGEVRRRQLLVTALICAGWIGLVIALQFYVPFQQAELASRDFLARFGRKAAPDPRLVYLTLDQASLELPVDPAVIDGSPALALMRRGWPFPREIYAALLDRLLGAGALAVGIDVLFPGPREGDGVFREALERHADRAVIAATFNEEGRLRSFMPPSPTLIPTAPEADPRVGYIVFWPDPQDEIVRRVRFRVTAEDYYGTEGGGQRRYTSFPARLLERLGLAAALPEGPVALRFIDPAAGARRDWLFDLLQRVGWVRPPGQLPRHSLYRIFVPRDWEEEFGGGEFFRGKIVVVGPFGNFMKDQLATPFGLLNGAELHLDAVNAALTGQFIAESGPGTDLAFILLGGAVAFGLAIPAGRPLLRFVTLLGAAAGYVVAAALAFSFGGYLPPLLSPVLALLASGVGAQAWQQVIDQIERARTRDTLERYVSKNVVKELLDEPSPFFDTLGGVRKPIAVMFSDLRGFTSMTEAGDSHAVVAQLNEYFEEMVKIVFAHGGTLDKFIGDAIMAVWGNIRSEGPAEDVRRCVAAALEMREALAGLNRRWRERGTGALAVGFGINFGEAIVGNIGSTEKMELTAIGDAVNLASRLEGVTKEYGIDLLLGEEAGELAAASFHLLEVDRVQVKGRSRPLAVHTVLGPKERPLDARDAALARVHGEALERYRHREFAAAADKFSECLRLRPDFPVAGVYLDRCAVLANDPPPPAWDGVYVMTKK